MSKYTTELRYICESLVPLQSSHGYNDINQILEDSWDKVFSFDFPIFDENYRKPLCKKILKHFYTREICEETYGLWKLRLDDRMNEIMPYYNKLYESELISIDPLINYRVNRSGNNSKTGQDGIAETGNGSVADTVHGTNVRTGGYTDTHDGTDTLEKTGKESLENKGKEYNTKTGNETLEKAGTETDVKSGNEELTKDGDIVKSKLGQVTDEKTGAGYKVEDFENKGGLVTDNTVDLFTDTPQGNIANMGTSYGTSQNPSDVPIVGDDTAYLTTAEKTLHEKEDKSKWQKKTGFDQDYKETKTQTFGNYSGEEPVPVTETQSFNEYSETKTYNDVTNEKSFDERIDTKTYNNVKDTKEYDNRIDEKSFANRKDIQTKDLTDQRIYNSQTDTADTAKQVYTNESKNKTMTYGNTNMYLDYVVGSKGKSDSQLLQEFRKTFLNIDEMILNKLADLFILLW